MAESMKTYVPAVPPRRTQPGTPQGGEPQGVAPRPEETSPAEPREYRPIAEGTQYVPAAKPPTLVEILPAQYQSTRPPLIYRLAKVSEPGQSEGRIAESRTYRAKAFSCNFFYKPISRCLVEWEER
jgi:hypothetical protein